MSSTIIIGGHSSRMKIHGRKIIRPLSIAIASDSELFLDFLIERNAITGYSDFAFVICPALIST